MTVLYVKPISAMAGCWPAVSGPLSCCPILGVVFDRAMGRQPGALWVTITGKSAQGLLQTPCPGNFCAYVFTNFSIFLLNVEFYACKIILIQIQDYVLNFSVESSQRSSAGRATDL